MQLIEKLGAFYLGKIYDLPKSALTDEAVIYDARDLTTHAVCVGMTGSGKTGLCIGLLEEAALDSVPAIIIDPKGDITNLLLTFPDLQPQDFQPWINADDARRKGMSEAAFAASAAESWRKGLAEWSEGPERIRALKDAAEFRIYTPGSDAGLPISIVSSFKAPALSWDDDLETLRDRVQGTVSALLGLVGVDADPLRSREHILLSNIFEHFWRQGQDLDLAKIINAIQSPPIRQLGVFDVDTFFPEKERFQMAMALNAIIASPSFTAWVQGEPMDIASFLHSPNGKPRHSIFYIAHLNDAERMFFVTLLLEQIVMWMRQQSGTTSLRALVYMDEVFGYFPPIANPPSKKPMLTLLKQARAFGVGIVLTSQNPVDLDYKGLANAGTWFIGKLQTDRDKGRVLDGLETAASAVGGALRRDQLDQIISSLGNRVFLMHNVHDDQPVIFQTRWAMSYLRGPLTRSQVRTLMAPVKAVQPAIPAPSATPIGVAPAPSGSAARPDLRPVAQQPSGYLSTPPSLPPGLPQAFLRLRKSANRALAALEEETGRQMTVESSALVYEPGLLALGSVDFVDRARNVSSTRRVGKLVYAGELGRIIPWADTDSTDFEPRDLDNEPEAEALFAAVPSELNTEVKIKKYASDFVDFLYREQEFELLYNPALSQYSQPGESERDFKARVQLAAREKRDAEVEKLQKKYETQIERLQTKLRREQQELAQDEAEHAARKREEIVSGAESVISILGIFGRRSRTGLSKAMTKRRLTTDAQADISESKATIVELEADIKQLQEDLQQEAEAIGDKWTEALDEVQTFTIKPRRTDVQVDMVALLWMPQWGLDVRTPDGASTHERIPAWK